MSSAVRGTPNRTRLALNPKGDHMTDIDLTIPAILDRTKTLPAMLDRAARMLSSATDAAQVLEAKEKASQIYDAAKRAARVAAAKDAHDDLIGRLHGAQAAALEIEAAAQRRLAEEYDAAQERGEIATGRDGPGAGVTDGNAKATAADIGLSRKEVHEARQIRDAEKAQPGIVSKTVNEALAHGEQPTRAKIKKAAHAVVKAKKPKNEPAPVKTKAGPTKALRGQVVKAITVLSSFPTPVEAVGCFNGTDDAAVIDKHLSRAVKWLNAFAELWPKQEADLADAA